MISRRRLLLGAAAALCTTVVPATATTAEQSLKLYNLHTGERLNATFRADGRYLPEQLAAINRLLRDHRSGEVAPIDTALLERLHDLQRQFPGHDTFHVISGYRSPRTNAMLQKVSNGVAKRSLHMQGRAIDIRLPGVDLGQLREAALAQQAGGVGYYPKSDFIHIDTGRTRFW